MEKHFVRIEEIEISDFKNVVHGTLRFDNPRKNYAASIVGLYGQNGSGKTALIDAVSLLKHLLSGKKLPVYFSDCINVDANSATIKYTFSVQADKTEYTAIYQLSIRKDIDESDRNIDDVNGDIRYKTTVFNEKLSCSYKSDSENAQMSVIANTDTDAVLVPNTKFKMLCGNDKDITTSLLVAKRIAQESSTSFLFSKAMLNALRKNDSESDGDGKSAYLSLFERLIWYGNYELFVIDTKSTGLIQFNALPLTYRLTEDGKTSLGSIPINLNDVTVIQVELYETVCKVIKRMNIVLEQLIPGLKIYVKKLGEQLMPNGQTGCRIQLVSGKNSKEIPLKYESEGIKKIVSILQLLIVMYNSASITVAVDELDSGVFEYLLGEILRIISEKGKGQLIFTSHNLRPLETLDKGFVAFTTTNPENRYIRLTNVKTNNNLRNFYYRDIILGEQDEPLYERTNNSEIALAFIEAGE